MAHHIYQIKAIILKHDDFGEAAKIFTLLTEHLGIIRASAQGIRHQASKLRYHTTLFSVVSVSVVKGKEWWRITGLNDAEPLPAFAQKMFARASDLLIKITDEGSLQEDHQIFNNLLALHQVCSDSNLQEAQEADKVRAHISEYEILCVYRLLYELGYIDASNFKDLVSTEKYDDEIIKRVGEHKKLLVAAINAGISSIGIK